MSFSTLKAWRLSGGYGYSCSAVSNSVSSAIASRESGRAATMVTVAITKSDNVGQADDSSDRRLYTRMPRRTAAYLKAGRSRENARVDAGPSRCAVAPPLAECSATRFVPNQGRTVAQG